MARKRKSKRNTPQDPQDAAAYYQRALALMKENDLQAAIKDFDEAIDLDPQHGQAFLQRGLALRKQGEIEQAIDDFTSAIETLSDRTDRGTAYYNRSIAYSSMGEMEMAYADIDQATALNPQLATKYSVLGIANPNKGASDEVDGDQKAAFVATSDDNSPEGVAESDAEERGEDKSGAEVLEDEPGPDAQTTSEKELIQSDEPVEDDARESQAAEDSVEAEPQDAKSHFNQGLAYYSEGEYELAAAQFAKAVSVDKKYAAAYYNQGNAHYELGDLDQAIACYNQAVNYFTVDADKADAYYNRARTYYDKGEPGKAVTEYDKAINLFTNDTDRAKAYNNRGLAHYEQAEYKRAIADYIEGINHASDDSILSILHRNRANALIKVNRLQDALLDCQKALELEPENPSTYVRLGQVYYQLGDHEAAISSYQEAEQLQSSPAEYNLEIALSKICLRQSEMALTDVRAALAREPGVYYLEGALQKFLILEQNHPNLPGLNQAIELIRAALQSASE